LTGATTKSIAYVRHNAHRINIWLVGAYVLAAVGILAIVIATYQSSSSSHKLATDTVLNPATVNVDQVVAANVATSVAQTAGMPSDFYKSVESLAISLNAKTEMDQTDDTRLNKPQIINPTSRDKISNYTIQSGDSVQSVAAKFGVSDDTIRWANNLTSDALTPGKTLTVLGTTGTLYTVKGGDTVASLADKYKADPTLIISFNDLEIAGLNAGQKIIIPNGILPANERPGYVAPSTSYASSISSIRISSFSGNGYAYGYCTYYAYNRRAQLGRPIGGNWGNAATWAYYARQDGFRVDKTPEVGAVMQTEGGWGGYTYFGHVGVVEKLNGDGGFTVSEMNATGGWNVVDYRTIPANQVSLYNFIH
jgi:surface antigen